MIKTNYTLATKICKMDQEHAIVDKSHNFDIFITIMNVIHTIAHQIEILMVIYIIIHETSLLIVTHGTFIVICAFSAHSNTANLFLFYLIMNDMNILNVIVCIIDAILTIIVQITGTFIILIIVAITNVILISESDTKSIIGCKFNESRIIWLGLNGNKTIAVIVIHYDKFDTSIRKMNYYYVIIINKIDMIMHIIHVIVKNKFYCVDIKLNVMAWTQPIKTQQELMCMTHLELFTIFSK